jgi:hypothetical protein
VKPGDRERIEEMLLEDPPLSCRAVSRATGYSDWTIRKIARELEGDPRPMRGARASGDLPGEVAAGSGWLIVGGIIIGVALLIWIGVRRMPPPEL